MKQLWLALIFGVPLLAQDPPPAPLETIYGPNHPAMRALALQKAPKSLRSDDPDYDRGSRALDDGKWQDAVSIFSKVADNKSSHADGALYWKAYAQTKLGQRDAAMATLAELQKNYASSRWLNDAKALQVQIQQQSGQPVSPNAESNDDLKMLALNGLLNSDPERAIPLLETVLKNNNTPRLKDRALFVLSQSNSPKAQQLLSDAAKGAFNPDLQLHALRYLAMGGGQNRNTLYSIYASSNDLAVKRAIIDYFVMSKFTGTNDPLVQIARTEKNPDLRREAIHRLGIANSAETGELLVSLYASETEHDIKGDIVNALFIQGNAKALVDLARKESNQALKQQIVQKLALMRSKDATDYMMEILSK
jgi:hypothetical protein